MTEQELDMFHRRLIGVNGTANTQANMYAGIARDILDKLEDCVKELEFLKAKIKKSNNITFLFDNGYSKVLPIMSTVIGLQHNGLRPHSYNLSFTPNEMIEWIQTEVEPAIKAK